MNKKVLYKGEVLILTRFWATGEACLWIENSNQRDMPKMEFVGGYPNEWCIFIKNLSAEEKKEITDLNGEICDLDKMKD